MQKVKAIQKINERELRTGVAGSTGGSWHEEYKDSPYCYVGGLPYELTEGDVVSVFSQYGEVTAVNLVRDKTTGKSRGFAFVGYADARSAVLAVDNFTGTVLLGRTLRVDHVKHYRKGKSDDTDTLVPPPPERTDTAETSAPEEEKDVAIDSELQEIEDKLRRAERRRERCERREREGEMGREEAEREREHLRRATTKLLRRQQRLWDTLAHHHKL